MCITVIHEYETISVFWSYHAILYNNAGVDSTIKEDYTYSLYNMIWSNIFFSKPYSMARDGLRIFQSGGGGGVQIW